MRKYGIGIAELAELLEAQQDRCAICRRQWAACKPAKHVRYGAAIFLHHLCVDHDHITGRVRGLLCNACNTALGHFEDDPLRFIAALEYLQRFDGESKQALP